MSSFFRSASDRGRVFAFPAVWAAVLVAGVSGREPLPSVDASSFLSFSGGAQAATPTQSAFFALAAQPPSLTFVRHDVEPDEAIQSGAHAASGGHGRFAAPGNAVRRQVQLRAINPRTADELAGFFREVSYTLTDIRQGEAVPAIRVERVPDDLVTKEGPQRKLLFITALLPVILEVNQRVLAEREQLVFLRNKMGTPAGITPVERLWLEQLADRYDTSSDKLDELLRRVDIVPPSMAIAQGGVESGWGTSVAARTGNSLFGMISAGRPQPFVNVGEAANAYVANLNTHAAYAAFRVERATMREHGEPLDGHRLIGTLLRYSELGQQYVGFIRQVMRDDKLTDFDKAKLSSY
jgi:Bax protein